MRLYAGLLAVCMGLFLSGCHRPMATFQPSKRAVFYTPTPHNVPEPVAETTRMPDPPAVDPDAAVATPPPGTFADSRPLSTPTTAQRVQHQQVRAQRLLTPRPAPTPPAAPDQPEPRSDQVQNGPGPKQRKTLRELLGLPPRKKLNWWQRISWQLKASVVVILVAVVFAILQITILAIIFGLIGAFLLVRGLKKSFKVRRGLFGL